MTETTKRPTSEDVAELAIAECGAPEDIRTYRWMDADNGGAQFGSFRQFEAKIGVALTCFQTTSYGTVGIGWDVAKRVAIYSWEPPE